MKIEIKNVKYMASLSEETHCFTASVYIDGKRVGEASNRGHGGMTDVHFNNRDVEKKVYAYVGTLPKIVSDTLRDPHDKTKPFTYEQSLDYIIDELVNRYLGEKELKQQLNKYVLFTCEEQEGIRCIKGKNKSEREQIAAHVEEKYNDVKILNSLSLDEAINIWNNA